MNLFCVTAIFVLAGVLGYIIRCCQERQRYPVFCGSREDEEYPEYDTKSKDTLHVKSRIFNPNKYPITLSSFTAETPAENKLSVQCIRCGQRVPATPLTIEGHDMCECELFVKTANDYPPEYLDIYYLDRWNKKRHALRYFSPMPT